MRRTHNCGQLRKAELGADVVLAGWVSARRDHGGLIFIDLRDRWGATQLVFDPKHSKAAHSTADKLRREDVIEVQGTVKERPEGMANPKLATGDIEVLCRSIEVLNKAAPPPIEVEDRISAAEELRLRWRYIDLRRPLMQSRLALRAKVAAAARAYLEGLGFLELETPMLVRHTPEGARDFVVPSRLHPGKGWALPQSPQLYKQLLMAAGFDRYFQLARCFRDEDLRQDRQPEFTQIDLEMSFIEEGDIMTVIEGMLRAIVKSCIGVELSTPFPRLSYAEAMRRFGTDKPDLRFGLEIVDLSKAALGSGFEPFELALSEKGSIAGLAVPAELSRSQLDRLTEIAKAAGLASLAWARLRERTLEGGITKGLSSTARKKFAAAAGISSGMLLIGAGQTKSVANALGRIRTELGAELKLYDPKAFVFCWIVDWPAFEWNAEEGRWNAVHHIFTAPKPEHEATLESKPGEVLSRAYDLVLNGVELGGGSIRIHKPELQERVMRLVGLSPEDARQKFGFLIEALGYGAPPHGGIALGLDRLVALLAGTTDIREVIAFPKTKSAECPMDSSPSQLEAEKLKELHLRFEPGRK